MTEVWKPITGFEGRYEVSDLGRVRSLPRVIHSPGTFSGQRRMTGRILKPFSHSRSGHQRVALYADGTYSRRMVHRIVLEAFVGPCPDGMEACHNNGDPSDNKVGNLRWDTKSANALDAVRHGTCSSTARTECSEGHPYSGDNLLIDPNGYRVCRSCRQQRNRRAYLARLSRMKDPQ